MNRAMRVRELAQCLQVEFEGDGDVLIDSAASLAEAGLSALSFATAKMADEAARSKAGCLIVFTAFIEPARRPLIRHHDPRGLFARALTVLYPEPPVKSERHPTAFIAPSAEVDASVEIGAFAYIGEQSRIGARTRIGVGCVLGRNVTIGEECDIKSRVSIYDRVRIGNRVKLHSGCVLGADGFGFVRTGEGYQKFPQVGTVSIEDDVEIGANSCVDRAALGTTRIRVGTKLDNMVHIGHNCDVGRHVVIAAQTGLSGGVVVEDYAVIGGQVGIGDKARIGSGAILGSGSGVLSSKIVRAGLEPLWGTPARPLSQHLRQLAVLSRMPELRTEIKLIKQRLAGSEDKKA